MLAAFSQARVPRSAWAHLEVCEGQGCPNQTCSAACWFGERAALLRLVRPANNLLTDTGLSLRFVTVVDPRHRRSQGDLASVPIDGIQQWLRRRFKMIEADYGKVRAVGGIEASFEVEQDGTSHWGPHSHFVVASECPTEALRAGLMPVGPRVENTRPVVIKPVHELANAIAYCGKREPAMRVAFCERRGTQNRQKRSASPEVALEYNRWLLGQGPTDRLILRGYKRVHGRLTLLR